MTSERFFRAPPLRLTLLAACAYASTLVGMIPYAHAQGGPNVHRTKPGASARPTSERATSHPVAESGGTNGDKGRRDSSGGDTGSAAYREFIEQGLAEFKLQNWPEARVLFRRAHELNPNARTARSIGMVSFEMREYVPAVIALTEALADTRQPLTSAQRKECEALLLRAQTFVGSFVLNLTPAQLVMTVDGSAPVRDAEGRLLVAFGEHTLQASAPDYETVTRVLTVEGGETKPLEIVLRRAAPQPLAVVQEADQRVAPRHDIVVGATAPETMTPAREGGLRYTWVALGASAAFGAAAVGTWMIGQQKFDTLRDQCEAGGGCVRGETDVSAPERLSRTTNVLLGLSAASLVAAVVLLPIEWPRERRVTLGVGPSQLSVRGSF
jgi:hypothetical protein